MTANQRNIVLGTVVLVGLGILVWMILLFAGEATSLFVARGLPITLRADRADGVAEGSAVIFRGVNVGKVTAIQRDADNEHVLIKAEVDNRPPLPANLIGIIKVQGALATGASIILDLTGEPSPKSLSANQLLNAKYVGFSLLPESVTGLAEQLQHEHLAEHMDQMILTVRDQVKKAGLVLDSIQKVVGDQTTRENLQTSVANIRRFSANLDVLSQNANSTVTDVRSTVNKTGQHVEDLSRQLDGRVQQLGALLAQFTEIAEKINHGHGTAGMLINDPRLYTSLSDTSDKLGGVVNDLHRLLQQWEQEGVPLKLH